MTARAVGAALVLAVGLALTGCGAAEEELGEAMTEEAIEQAMEQGAEGSGTDVEVDGDSGAVSIQSDEGSLEMGGGDLPDGFPEDLPLPPGDYTVGMSMATTGEDAMLRVTLLTQGSVEEIAEHLETGLAASSFTVEDTIEQSMGEQRSVTRMITGNGMRGSVGVMGGATEDQVTVLYSLAAEEPAAP